MELIDIGCNLTHDSFNQDRDDVMQHARDAGVVQMIITGGTEQGSIDALDLAKTHPDELFATAGIHPHHAVDFTADSESVLRELSEDPVIVAAGETGLDYFRDFSPRPQQRKAFERQLQMGIDTGLPLFLHQREAHDDFIAIIREHRQHVTNLVVHCFTGSQAELREYLELDCHIGLTGWICDERRGTQMQDFLQDIPLDRLMVETDSPYLKPRDIKPRVKTHRNEPRWLPWIVKTISGCRTESEEEIAFHTTNNARSFFNLPASAIDQEYYEHIQRLQKAQNRSSNLGVAVFVGHLRSRSLVASDGMGYLPCHMACAYPYDHWIDLNTHSGCRLQ
jgi:TatD DNase family protein